MQLDLTAFGDARQQVCPQHVLTRKPVSAMVSDRLTKTEVMLNMNFLHVGSSSTGQGCMSQEQMKRQNLRLWQQHMHSRKVMTEERQ